MSLIYLASPYSHEDPKVREERYEKVLAATAHFIHAGFFIFSPIVDGHFITKYWKEHEVARMGWDYWHKFDTIMIKKCDSFWIFMLNGWQESVGVQAELKLAKSLFMPICYVDEEYNIWGNSNVNETKSL